MKHKFKNQFLIAILLLFTLTSCNSNDDNEFKPTLPEATQTGANTFGCYIDGNLLIPRDGTGYYGGSDDGMYYTGSGTAPNYLYNEIKVHDYKSNTNGIMDLTFKKLFETGEGAFNIENSNNCESTPEVTINIRCRINNTWYCSIENTGTLTITRYDYENRIFSGVFNCKAVNRDNPDDIVDITQGRFDIKWDTLSSVEFP